MTTDKVPMTVDCAACGFPFGRWRERCPACGTDVPRQVRQSWLAETSPSRPAPRKTRESNTPRCILCRQTKARVRCPHCDEPIHPVCLSVHLDDCKRFQETLQQATQASSAMPAGPPPGSVQATTDFVRSALKGDQV